MGLDVIARNRDWHIQPCSKDDVEGARQGLCKLVTFMCPEKETTAENQIWTLTSLVPVVQRADNFIRLIGRYPVDKTYSK